MAGLKESNPYCSKVDDTTETSATSKVVPRLYHVLILGTSEKGDNYNQHLFLQAISRYAITLYGVKSVGTFADLL